MALGKLTLTVALGVCVLACGADPGDAVDEGASSSEEDSRSEEASRQEASRAATNGEKADDDACSEDADPSTPEGALAAYARLRGQTECPTIQLTRRGKPVRLEYSIK